MPTEFGSPSPVIVASQAALVLAPAPTAILIAGQTAVLGAHELSAKPPAPSSATSLTAREHEVVRLMAAGYSNREIGQILFVAEGTIKNHVSNILTKLGVRDRTRAVLKAAEQGLL